MPIARGAAAATIGLGFFAMVVFWWYPFGLILSSVGLVIGLICLACKVRGLHGENHALIGTIFCVIDITTILTLTQGVQVAFYRF